jgi:hypothetical protein
MLVAAAAATQHEAAGLPPDLAYEHAVIEAALADPKVQAVDDGKTLPSKLPDQAGRAASGASPAEGPENVKKYTLNQGVAADSITINPIPDMADHPISHSPDVALICFRNQGCSFE